VKIALVGLAGSGKTTVFSAITGLRPDEKELLKTHLGVVTVPDERLDELARLLNPKKVTHTEAVFVDTHGFDLVHAREADALVIVIGVFSGASAKKDAQEICADLILADLEIVDKRLSALKKEIESGKNLRGQGEYTVLARCKAHLDKPQPLRTLGLTREEQKTVSGYQFVSLRHLLFIANVGEEQIGSPSIDDLRVFARQETIPLIEMCAKVEQEILQLPEAERAQFLKGMGISELSEDAVIKAAYRSLDLVSFFTVKGDENKSWPVKKGSSAIEAAGKVHTDIQRGFIKAEVINYKDFIACGDFNEAKKRGLLRLEGKDYAVQDGDIINFKFNV